MPEKGSLDSICRFKRGRLAEEEVRVFFEGGADTPMHTMIICRILQFSRKTFATLFSLYQIQNQKIFFVTNLTMVDHETTSEILIILSYVSSVAHFCHLVG